jgi:hypothetical protein
MVPVAFFLFHLNIWASKAMIDVVHLFNSFVASQTNFLSKVNLIDTDEEAKKNLENSQYYVFAAGKKV